MNICKSWRGISLLDVAGLLGRILQERLQIFAVSILPDSECDFRQGRSCLDIIFVTRQLVEKAKEHSCLLFALFIDIKKAYDLFPKVALWQVLERSMEFPYLFI